MVKILFVCMGNICRSPTAQGVFEKLVEEEGLGNYIRIDSAGTHAYHVGDRPDNRATLAASRRGIDLSNQQARRVQQEDLAVFDYIVAMDSSNYRELLEYCPPGNESKLRMFMEYAPDLPEQDVPDPYYGGPNGFERVLDLIEEAAMGLLASIRQEHKL
jgi:protein-tyrosine phosphatase